MTAVIKDERVLRDLRKSFARLSCGIEGVVGVIKSLNPLAEYVCVLTRSCKAHQNKGLGQKPFPVVELLH